MTAPRIYVLGDSYSSIEHDPIFTWIEALSSTHPVTCLGQNGASNEDILAQVPDSWDVLLISLSPLVRPPFIHNIGGVKDGEGNIRANMRAAYKLTKLHNSYCWSTCTDYKTAPGIEYIQLGRMDELNLQDETRKIGFPDEQFTGCHFTREGNESIAEHMRNVIERVLKNEN